MIAPVSKPLVFWQRHYRHIIYVLVFLCVLLPMFLPVKLRVNVSPPTRNVFNAVDTLAAARHDAITNLEAMIAATTNRTGIARLKERLDRLRMNTNGVLMLSCDFAPDTAPELEPMAVAILRHAFARNVRVLALTPSTVTGVQLAEKIIGVAARQSTNLYSARVDGRDYLFLGFRPNMFQLLMAMGENISHAYVTDNAGRDLATQPFMRGIQNYNDIDLIVSITGYTGVPEMWIQVAHTRNKRPLGFGFTAVGVTDYYPYLHSKQIIGLLAGLRGAAEYEIASGLPDAACGRMFSQFCSHLLVIVLVIVGNIEFIYYRRRTR